MSQLQMYPRDDSEYLGKVYFCSHPDDRELYLSSLSHMLMQQQNCSVWYLPQGAERDKEFYESLKTMQLLVMPVTKLLLTTKNDALEDLRFAQHNGIPVLPIIQESGLEPLFNRVCGQLHCLSVFGKDDTDPEYGEKLARFLKTIFVSDSLAAQIRRAFDAYIFLSYRKKDRRYARELMHLIHRDPKFRDVAIWYDEFLTPGEDFNEAIRGALKKSHLFAMAVTPNLLEKVETNGVLQDNYVAAHEYPTARALGKPILPAELVPTDRSKLCALYEALPRCVDPRQPSQLAEALAAGLEGMLQPQREDTPEHQYLIGMAYLTGLDVEVDTARGAELILRAARTEYLPAMEQAVHMYRNGQGVERNAGRQLDWQWRIVRHLFKKLTDGLLEISRRKLDMTYSDVAFPGSKNHMVRYENLRALQQFQRNLNASVQIWLRRLLETVRQLGQYSGPEKALQFLRPSLRFLEAHGNEDMYRLGGNAILNSGEMDAEVLEIFLLEVELLLQSHQYRAAREALDALKEKFCRVNEGFWQGRAVTAMLCQRQTELQLARGAYDQAEECRTLWVAAIQSVVADFSFAPFGIFQPQELEKARDKAAEFLIEYGKVTARLALALGRTADAEDAYAEIFASLKMLQRTDAQLEAWAYLQLASLGTEKAAEYLKKAAFRLTYLPEENLHYLPLHRDLAMLQGDLEGDPAHYRRAWTLSCDLVRYVPVPDHLAAMGLICQKACALQPELAQELTEHLHTVIDTCRPVLKRAQGAMVLAELYEIIWHISKDGEAMEKAKTIFSRLVEKYPECLRYQARLDRLTSAEGTV